MTIVDDCGMWMDEPIYQFWQTCVLTCVLTCVFRTHVKKISRRYKQSVRYQKQDEEKTKAGIAEFGQVG